MKKILFLFVFSTNWVVSQSKDSLVFNQIFESVTLKEMNLVDSIVKISEESYKNFDMFNLYNYSVQDSTVSEYKAFYSLGDFNFDIDFLEVDNMIYSMDYDYPIYRFILENVVVNSSYLKLFSFERIGRELKKCVGIKNVKFNGNSGVFKNKTHGEKNMDFEIHLTLIDFNVIPHSIAGREDRLYKINEKNYLELFQSKRPCLLFITPDYVAGNNESACQRIISFNLNNLKAWTDVLNCQFPL